MNHFRFAALSLLLICVSHQAQTTSPPASRQNKQTPAAKDLDPETAQRRSVALSVLESLAIEARSYRDEPLRARVQARIADALWDQDKEAARNLFRRAWEVAESVEISAATSDSAPGRLPQSRPLRPRMNLRREILQLAAKRDHTLGEEFLRKFNAPDQKYQKDQANNSTSRPEISEAEIAGRLSLAGGFLEEGEMERALQFADPALVRANESSIWFLVKLREKNAVAADQRFAALLSLAAADPASDANTVSYLTSYAVTPSFYLRVSQGGIPSSNTYVPARAAPDLAPALRKSYFQAAANILLRPFAQIDQSSAGRSGTYFIATRLLPLFQQHAPDLAPSITAQLAALGPEAGRATAKAGDVSVNRGMSDNVQREGFENELNDRLKSAQGSDARDRAYAFAAWRAAEENDPRARDFVDKIEDLETRAGVRRFVDINFIRTQLSKKRADEALALISKAELPHTLRAHFLTQAAAILAEKNQTRALALLDEALTETRRIDASTAERAYCLVALLTQFSKLDKSRGWQLLSEMVKSANAVNDFTGENGNTNLMLEGKFSIRLGTELAKPADLSTLFGSLAEDNFYQAMDAARTFAGEAPRATAAISVARATFEKKPERKSASQNQER